MPETVDGDKTEEWTRKGDLKVETELKQEQALRTNYAKFIIANPSQYIRSDMIKVLKE